MDILKDIPERLWKIKEHYSLSDVDFSAIMKVSGTMLQYYRKGTSQPKLDVLVNILNRFPELSRDWLIFGEGGMFRDLNAVPNIYHEIAMLRKRLESLESLFSDGLLNRSTDPMADVEEFRKEIQEQDARNLTNIPKSPKKEVSKINKGEK